MLAENNDDDPVTLKAFNEFQKEMFKRCDVLLRTLEMERKAQEDERKAQKEERKAQEEERKAQEEERKAQKEERKAQEEERKAQEEERKAQEEERKRLEAWKEEKSLMGVINKIISSYYDTMHRVKVD